MSVCVRINDEMTGYGQLSKSRAQYNKVKLFQEDLKSDDEIPSLNRHGGELVFVAGHQFGYGGR